ncbi:hypothetical protein ATANTOWER_029501 [Ataeniobius toweri]|uniref:Uncharacterized protein n=1 Tax=Ataeniobius toweri TaxID=208326 RepID=A0ABU7B2V5_9TELE|nr:hypothetical protein [Ataeniobius toweri]
MTALRQRRLSKILEAPNITYTHEGINMADGITQGEPHQCEELVSRTEKERPDLEASPLEGPQDGQPQDTLHKSWKLEEVFRDHEEHF